MLSHKSLMIGTISLASIHLALSVVLFTVLLIEPAIVKPNYINIFIYISILVNFIIFFLCIACKNSSNTSSAGLNNLMDKCMGLSLLHFVVSLLMLNFVTSNNIIIVFLLISIIVNNLIINTSNQCKNLEG